ncbi:hypothetical protein [Yoonia sp. 2307UL14-13]|uniref:hypothetical protein n=1 Tax=Yoonia sp. 2307UL14-13 TaxID=3126506 RepID=UPI0030A94B3A
MINILAFLTAALWVVWVRRGSHHTLWLIPAALFAVMLATPPFWHAALAGYPKDSFWTLGPSGRAGVVAIATSGILAIFLMISAKTRALFSLGWPRMIALPIDIATGLLMFGAIYSLSPQAFYAFYQLIIPDLPAQWVIDTAFDTGRIRHIVHIGPDGSMSDHLAGIGFWAVWPFTFWLHFQPDARRG